jgi:acyl dehydratase
MEHYTLENITEFIGQEIGVSDWITIDQARINAFADATLDHQWIHVDEEKAAKSPLGSTIAHGYLTLSLLSKMLEEVGVVPSGVGHVLNYGADKLRFTSFVKVNSRIRTRVKLLSVTPKQGGSLLKTVNTVEIEGAERPALVAEILSLVFPA